MGVPTPPRGQLLRLVALIGRHDGRVVAVASYDGLREPGVAEVSFAWPMIFRGTGSDPDAGAARGGRSVIAAGLGGLQAHLTETAAFRLPPATDTEADELIDSAKGVAAELTGLRGSAPLDREALRELILRFTLLLAEVPEVAEADLNPVRCMTRGCLVLDMRVRIEHQRPIDRVETW